jgi:large subunit ribosomal protein L21
MYAVIETGGKQYRVEVGTELEVELLDVEPGKTVTIDRVLLVADGDDSSIGRPLVADASVSAEVVAQTRGPKLISFKYRPKARSRVKKGHRQELTVLRIADITLGGKSAAKAVKKAETDAGTERRRLEEAAATQAAKDAELAAKLAVGTETAAPKPARAKSTTEAKTKPTPKAKAAPAAKAEPKTAAKAEPKTAAKTAPAAKADTKTAAAKAKPAAKPKASQAKTSETPAKTPAKPAAPKRTRTPKKDE